MLRTFLFGFGFVLVTTSFLGCGGGQEASAPPSEVDQKAAADAAAQMPLPGAEMKTGGTTTP